jgi:hypothetical protein
LLTSALDGVSSQLHPPTPFFPGKGPPVPIVQEAGWATEPVWTQRFEENFMGLYNLEYFFGLHVGIAYFQNTFDKKIIR